MMTVNLVLMAVLMAAASVYYCRYMLAGNGARVMTTWAIITVGVGLSWVTYITYGGNDWLSNAANLIDFVASLCIVVTIVVSYGPSRPALELWDWIGLMFVPIILYQWLGANDSSAANFWAQAMMTVAYVPSWKKLATGEENPEPFTFWFMILAISALAASQGYVGGNTTAVWYGLRSLVISVSILVLMERLEFYSMLKRVFAKLN